MTLLHSRTHPKHRWHPGAMSGLVAVRKKFLGTLHGFARISDVLETVCLNKLFDDPNTGTVVIFTMADDSIVYDFDFVLLLISSDCSQQVQPK